MAPSAFTPSMASGSSSAISTDLPQVLPAGPVEALGDELITVAQQVMNAVSEAHDRWGRLSEVFTVTGAEGAYAMLDVSVTDASDFAMALNTAYLALQYAAAHSLPRLHKRRAQLIERIGPVNTAMEQASADVQTAETAYWSAYAQDPLSDATASARANRMDALHARDDADRDASDLRADIEKFRGDVEDAEDELAAELRGISGGDEVHGAWGEPVRVSQTYWGVSTGGSPMYGGSSTVIGLAERLRRALSDGVADRISWLATATPEEVQAWTSQHPDFPSAVGFVDAERASRLWEGLYADSTVQRERGSWMPPFSAGPLAQLFALAPYAIGNLNGLAAADRSRYSSEYLRQLLAGDDLSKSQRKQLEQLEQTLSVQDGTLLSLFLDTDDGSPRASVAFGDIDSADQVTTLSHGIETDLDSIEDWSAGAGALRRDLQAEMARRGADGTAAVVVFMEWDSGSKWNVWNIERPDGGAERLAQLLRGVQHTNPDAQRNLGLHSLGTTMGTQTIGDNPGLVDNVWLYGSAGVTDETAAALAKQIRDGQLTVHATHAEWDKIAPVGRWPVSEHSVDPRTIEGVQVFSSDGGLVAGFGDGEQGARTGGHGSHGGQAWYDPLLNMQAETLWDGSVMFSLSSDPEAAGYLDPRSQSYKQSVVDMVTALIAEQESR